VRCNKKRKPRGADLPRLSETGAAPLRRDERADRLAIRLCGDKGAKNRRRAGDSAAGGKTFAYRDFRRRRGILLIFH